MAGGTWMSQNKVQPGVYINTKSKGNMNVHIGEKGIVSIAEPLSWGESAVVQELIPGEDLTPYIGYDMMSSKAMFLREMMKGSDITQGPAKILLYRLGGTNGAKATAVIGELTATALYEGMRGNDITVIVQENPDGENQYEVVTAIDGAIADEQSVAQIQDLVPNNWVSFSGSGSGFTETAGTGLIGGTDPTITPADHAEFLLAIEPYRFDIIIYDGAEQTIIQAYAAFVKRLSQSVGQKCQAVMANAEDSNSEWVISVNNGVKLSDGTVLTPQQATWWVGGAEAGALYKQSLTYVQYPGAVEASPKFTDGQLTGAIQKGKMTFIDTFGKVKVCTDINTLTSFTTEKGQEFSKNRVMRVLNQICNDVYEQFSNYYIGKTDNNDAGRSLLKGWLVGYLNEMQANNGIKNFVADDVAVREGCSVDSVLLDVAVTPVDSIEKIYMSVLVSANTQE